MGRNIRAESLYGFGIERSEVGTVVGDGVEAPPALCKGKRYGFRPVQVAVFDNTREGMYGPQVHIGDAGLLLRSTAAREDGGLRFGNTGDRNGTSAATGNRHGRRFILYLAARDESRQQENQKQKDIRFSVSSHRKSFI